MAKYPLEDQIPREMVWVYPIAPLVAAPLLLHGAFSAPVGVMLRLVAGLYVPFLTFSLVCHLLYRYVVPRVFQHVGPGPGRWAVHLAIIVAVPVVLIPFNPILRELSGVPLTCDLPGTLISMVITALFVVPGTTIQNLRNRAAAGERLVAEAQRASLRAELSALQARTNPHFFFNAMNTVAALIPEDPVLAERTLERLADLFRYALDAGRTPLVPLAREVEVVRDYLSIQAARFGDRLTTSVTLDEDAKAVLVPPLLLQPLVENAVLHGFSSRQRGTVHVRVRRDGESVRIEVEDDGPGPGASTHRGSRTSLDDLRARLRMTYGERGRFALERATGGGCLARVELPVGA